MNFHPITRLIAYHDQQSYNKGHTIIILPGGALAVTVGLILLAISIILIICACLSYKKEAQSLLPLKQEDLVSYYLDLAYRLLPVPFWCALVGVALLLVAIIIILISLPFAF